MIIVQLSITAVTPKVSSSTLPPIVPTVSIFCKALNVLSAIIGISHHIHVSSYDGGQIVGWSFSRKSLIFIHGAVSDGATQ